MKVSSITIRNVLGLKEFNCDPGQITLIKGHNAAGKSSILKALQNVFNGGSLAELRSLDATEDDKTEVSLVLDSDDYGRVLVNKNEKRLQVKKQVGDSAAFETVKAPQRFIEALFDIKMNNPIEFVKADDKKRVELLLESLDLDYDPAALWEQIDLNPADFDPVPKGLHPLKEIAEHRHHIFKTRTAVNSDEKRARMAMDKARRAVPAEIPIVEDVEAKQARLTELKEELARERAEIQAKLEKCQAGADSLVSSKEEWIRGELEKYRRELEADLEKKFAEKRDWADTTIKDVVDGAKKMKAAAREKFENDCADIVERFSEVEDLASEIAKLREQAEDSTRIRIIHEQANEYEQEADDLKNRSVKLTNALTKLDAFKATLSENLPIKGLDITDNKIKLNGIPWGQLNTAEQLRIAVKVATLRFDGPFRPVWVDGAEALDAEMFEQLKAELIDAGAQAFFAKVTDGDLEVESE